MVSHERVLKQRVCAIQFPSKDVKTSLWLTIVQKPTEQPMMKFSQLICLGKSCLEPKLKKKSVRRILRLFLFHIFFVCERSVLQIFILLCMNVKSELISYSWTWCGVVWVDSEKKMSLHVLVPSLSMGSKSFILAICWHLIVQVSLRIVKDLSKQ